MTSMMTAANLLEDVHRAVTAAHFGAVLLMDERGQEVARAGDLELPPAGGIQAQLSDQRDWQIDGLPEGLSVVPSSLEGYGSVLGLLLWLCPGEPREQARQSAGLANKLLQSMGVLDFELENLSRELAETYESVHLLCDVTNASSNTSSVADLCAALLEHLARQVKCRAGAILLRPESGEEDTLRIHATFGAAPVLKVDQLVAADGILAEALVADMPLLVDQIDADSEDSFMGLARQSLVAAALVAQEQAIGVLVLLDRDSETGCFDSRDRKLVDAVATQGASMILGMRMLEVSKELEIGQRIQKTLLPQSLPEPAGLELAGLCTMARVVGGDFYDAVLGPDGELRAVIADVSGHDLGAALLMAAARSLMRSELRTDKSPSEMVARLNELLYEDLERAGLFLTYFVVCIHPRDRLLRFSGGGHNPPLLLHANGRMEMLDSQGLPAGLTPDARFREDQRSLEPGDLLMLYTDGLTEATSPKGALFGEQRLGEALLRHRQQSADQILQSVEQEIRDFAGGAELQDDGTAIMIKVSEQESSG
jgi:hypothetical protein